MKIIHLQFLACPECKSDLNVFSIKKGNDTEIIQGCLKCSKCDRKYPIIRSIPRFVPQENYASSFGFEWLKHPKTQFDSFTGTKISNERFFSETQWKQNLVGEAILEVGCGAGRFTEIAISTGAMIVSLDLSIAVDANYESNGNNPNLLIAQGDIYHLPVKENFFNKIFCFGVLQHTPDVEKSFLELPKYLQEGGNLVIDVYRRYKIPKCFFQTRYFIRKFTNSMKHEKLYHVCEAYINLTWNFSKYINKIPKVGRSINWIFLIPDYRGVLPLSDDILKRWAILDLFDILSPAYDSPQYIEDVEAWFEKSGLTEIDVHYGHNGIVGRGTKRDLT